VRHAAGSLDRLLTYARGAMLSEAQLQVLQQESIPDDTLEAVDLLAAFDATVERALDQLRSTDPATLTDRRLVGRGRLPSTVVGLLFHAAEHTQRHAGQVATLARGGGASGSKMLPAEAGRYGKERETMPEDNLLWSSVDGYLDGLFVGDDRALEDTLRSIEQAGMPAISVSPSQGKLLHVLARAVGARRMLELGTLAGYSTIWLARALPPDGRLVTIEFEAAHARVARANIARAGVEACVDLREGAALDVLPQLTGLAPFDLVFIDADKVNYPSYLEWAIRLGRVGTLIIADNVIRDGEVANPESEDGAVQAMRQFLSAAAGDARLSATAVQTVGAKGYDGFAFITVTDAG
jgi:predicted O-methyltransferase YrrM